MDRYISGRGKYGRCGLGNEQNVLFPKLLNFQFEKYGDSLNKIILGGDDGYILSTFGDIYVWGKNLEGQLGFYNNGKNVLKPVRLRLSNYISNNYKIMDCKLGDCHTLLLMTRHQQKVNKQSGYNDQSRGGNNYSQSYR